MALQTTGQISLKNIADEFGDTAPHSMSEFYGAASGIPSSGAITIGNFYGASAGFTFNKTISTNTIHYNLRNDMIANGWDGVMRATVTVTINSGVYVYATSTSTAAFTTGTMSSGTTVSIINNGYIMGKGGNGQTPTQQPQEGGPAVDINYSVSITNNSYIAGGGGGGGGGGTSGSQGGGGGGAGGGTGGVVAQLASGTVPAGGSGGSIGLSGGAGTQSRYGPVVNNRGSTFIKIGSGGGGGRILPGTAGAAGLNVAGTTDLSGGGGGAGGGGGGRYQDINGVVSSALGGAGGSAGNTGGNANPSGVGGGGGGWGASGGVGNVPGALGGRAVKLNGYSVTWVATGTRYGAIS